MRIICLNSILVFIINQAHGRRGSHRRRRHCAVVVVVGHSCSLCRSVSGRADAFQWTTYHESRNLFGAPDRRTDTSLPCLLMTIASSACARDIKTVSRLPPGRLRFALSLSVVVNVRTAEMIRSTCTFDAPQSGCGKIIRPIIYINVMFGDTLKTHKIARNARPTTCIMYILYMYVYDVL